jgi:hypothetical protein
MSFRHITTRTYLERFVNQKYGELDYYLKDVVPEFFDRLHSYFLVDRDCNNNTSVKYIRNFAKIIRLAYVDAHALTSKNLEHGRKSTDWISEVYAKL